MEIFHFLGLCPDSMSHVDLMDVVVANWGQIHFIFLNLKNKYYEKY